jgi:hypothetical protein
MKATPDQPYESSSMLLLDSNIDLLAKWMVAEAHSRGMSDGRWPRFLTSWSVLRLRRFNTSLVAGIEYTTCAVLDMFYISYETEKMETAYGR